VEGVALGDPGEVRARAQRQLGARRKQLRAGLVDHREAARAQVDAGDGDAVDREGAA
jgi:hypothetical protein